MAVRLFEDSSYKCITLEREKAASTPGDIAWEAVTLFMDSKVLKYRAVDGLGRGMDMYVELSGEEVGELAEQMRSVRTDDEFDGLVERFHLMREKRERLAMEKFYRLADAVRRLAIVDERVRLLRDVEEKLGEIAKEFAEELARRRRG